MSSVQFIQVTPQQLQEEILKGVKNEIEVLKAYLQPNKQTEYLTREETANLLKINLSTLHNWTKKGTISSYSLEGRVYYKRSDIDGAMVESLKVV